MYCGIINQDIFYFSHLLTVLLMWYNEVRIVPRFRRVYGFQDKLAGETSISVSLLPIHLLTAIHDKRRL